LCRFARRRNATIRTRRVGAWVGPARTPGVARLQRRTVTSGLPLCTHCWRTRHLRQVAVRTTAVQHLTAQFSRCAVGPHRRPLGSGRRVRAGLADFVVATNRGRSTLGNAAVRQIACCTSRTSVRGIPFAGGSVATLAKVIVAAVVPRRETFASRTTTIRRITNLGNRITSRAAHPPRVVRGTLLQLIAGATVSIRRWAANCASGVGGVTNGRG